MLVDLAEEPYHKFHTQVMLFNIEIDTINEITHLIQKYGVHARGSEGQTLLHMVILQRAQDRPNLLPMFLEYDLNPNIQDTLGQTPLHLALVKHDYDSVRLLMEHGADPNIPVTVPIMNTGMNRYFRLFWSIISFIPLVWFIQPGELMKFVILFIHIIRVTQRTWYLGRTIFPVLIMATIPWYTTHLFMAAMMETIMWILNRTLIYQQVYPVHLCQSLEQVELLMNHGAKFHDITWWMDKVPVPIPFLGCHYQVQIVNEIIGTSEWEHKRKDDWILDFTPRGITILTEEEHQIMSTTSSILLYQMKYNLIDSETVIETWVKHGRTESLRHAPINNPTKLLQIAQHTSTIELLLEKQADPCILNRHFIFTPTTLAKLTSPQQAHHHKTCQEYINKYGETYETCYHMIHLREGFPENAKSFLTHQQYNKWFQRIQLRQTLINMITLCNLNRAEEKTSFLTQLPYQLQKEIILWHT